MAKYIHVVLRLPPRVAQLLVFAKLVLAALTGNPHFTNPSPALTNLDAAIKALEAVLKGNGADRKAAVTALKDTLQHLADYVQLIAETQAGTVDIAGIQALVESANMRLRKVSPRQKAAFGASYGPVPGSVDLTAPASRAGDPHEWSVSTDQHTWTVLPTTRKAATQVTGLPVGVMHYFRHRLLTKDGPTEWSDPFATIVVK